MAGFFENVKKAVVGEVTDKGVIKNGIPVKAWNIIKSPYTLVQKLANNDSKILSAIGSMAKGVVKAVGWVAGGLVNNPITKNVAAIVLAIGAVIGVVKAGQWAFGSSTKTDEKAIASALESPEVVNAYENAKARSLEANLAASGANRNILNADVGLLNGQPQQVFENPGINYRNDWAEKMRPQAQPSVQTGKAL